MPTKKNKSEPLFFTLALLFIFANAESQIMPAYKPYGSQEAIDIMNAPIGSNQLTSNLVFKGGGYYIINGGWGLSLSVGGWVRNNYLQSSTNLGLNLVCGRKNMGNKEDVLNQGNNNTYQFNLNFSPMLSFNMPNSKVNWYQEEINPMYYGHSSAVYNSFQSAITIGSTFITTPKGTYNNITSPRNRSQQLIFFQIKIGGTPGSAKNPSYFNSISLTVCEDYLFDAIQPFADLRDRFYTGGGNLQIRTFNNVLFKYYTETYTGNSYPDKQDYPDLVLPAKSRWALLKRKGSYFERFAYQDAGQSGLNKARNLYCVEVRGLRLDNPVVPVLGNLEIVLGFQGQMNNAWSQHIIHNLVGVQKNKTVFKTTVKEKLHHFDFRNYKSKFVLGAHLETQLR